MARKELLQEIIETMGAFKRLAQSQALLAADCPVSYAQLELLLTIDTHPGATAKHLAEQLRMTPGAISQFIEGLEQHKLLERQTDPNDRRVQYLHITRAGSKLLRDTKRRRKQRIEQVMQGLSDEELAIWLRVQQKFVAQVQAESATKTKSGSK